VTKNSARRIWELARAPLIAWGGLCALLTFTVILAYVPLGPMNLPISLFIAAIKTAIIAVVFMQLGSASGLIRLAGLTGLLWLLFLFLLTFTDYLSR
jgi:caa(3)-type oxidase subunit IV